MTVVDRESCELHRKSAFECRGITFGSYDGAALEDASMTTAAPSHHRGHSPRQCDRRRAIADLIAGLSRAIDRRHDISTLRSVFEETLRRIMPIRSVQLREGAFASTTHRRNGRQAEAVALKVPGLDPDRHGLLEASFDPTCGLGEWDFQTLDVAAHIGSLVLEIERLRLHLARVGLWNTASAATETVPTIVGSTPAIAALRGLIDRVASTDFTVLLEGQSDPQ